MKSLLWLLRQGVGAMLTTVVLSALTHMAIVFYAFLRTGNVAYINPVEFLGLQTIAPQYSHSAAATAIGWAVLIAASFPSFSSGPEYISERVSQSFVAVSASSGAGKTLARSSYARQAGSMSAMVRETIDDSLAKYRAE